MNILLVIGHSNPNSLSHYFARIYAENSAHKIKVLDLATMDFDPLLRHSGKGEQELEDDLKQAQDFISWSNHIVFFFPIWWSLYPAVLKGFFDRVFLAGFAFSYKKNSPFMNKLLNGKTSDLLITSDSPTFYRKYILNDPAVRALKRDTLGFCGIKVNSVKYFGPVRNSDEKKILVWGGSVKKLAKKRLLWSRDTSKCC